MCVCVCARARARVRARACSCVYIRHNGTHVTPAETYLETHTRACFRTHISDTLKHTLTHAGKNVQMRECSCMCAYMCARACVCVCALKIILVFFGPYSSQFQSCIPKQGHRQLLPRSWWYPVNTEHRLGKPLIASCRPNNIRALIHTHTHTHMRTSRRPRYTN